MATRQLAIRNILAAALIIGAQATVAHALPFNDDMVDNQKRTGVIMRGAPKGSVPVGFEKPMPKDKAEASALNNPVAAEPVSIQNGDRLFRVNCFPCHGDISKQPYQPGPVSVNSKGTIPGIDIGVDAYLSKPDGYIYATIHYGGLAIMPALGWKLSDSEHWDIVNYVRSVEHSRAAQAKSQQ